MFRKGIALVVMLLFVGLSIYPSTGDIVEDDSPCDCKSEEINNSIATTDCGNFAYIVNDYYGGFGLFAWNFEDMVYVLLCDLTSLLPFPCGITCRDDKIIAVDGIGDIYEINPNTCNVSFLGSTGLDVLVDVEYDLQAEILWGISTDSFYGINMTTYEATLIGPMGNPSLMINLAGDINGNIWALEFSWTGAPLYKINTSTGEAILIGNTGVSANFGDDISYNYCDSSIYFCLFNYATFAGELWAINVTNAQVTFIGSLLGGISIPMFTIPYTWSNQSPITTISLYPPSPDGDNGYYVSDVEVYLKAWDADGISKICYRIAGGEWINHSGDYTYFILDYYCLIDWLIEYYSVDYFGNQDEIKSVSIDIDQLPPEVKVEVETFKVGGKWYVIFNIIGEDTCSGGDRVEMFINDGEHEIIVGAGPTYEFVVEWSKAFKSVTFWFYCYDLAGNVASVSVNGLDIKSFPNNHISNFHQFQSLWSFGLLERFPILQRLLERLIC